MAQTYSLWLPRWLPRPLAVLALLLATAGAAQAQTLAIAGTGGSSTNNIAAFVDRIEIVRASDGTVVTGAIANAGFETPAQTIGGFTYHPTGGSWTFLGLTGISYANGTGTFSPSSTPDGVQVAYVQNAGTLRIGNTISQALTLAAGSYRVRFLAAQSAYLPLDQGLVVTVGGAQVGTITPTSTSSYTSYSSNLFTVNSNGTVTSAPTVTSLNPASAPLGTSITLTGTNLTGATAVSFNGTAATTFAIVNATTITATVSTGATSGNVSVTTPGGTSGGVAFTVIPTITWTGAVGNAYISLSNWDLGRVPTSADNVVIPPTARQPVLSPALGIGQAGNLLVQAGASLTLDAQSELDLYGNLTNNGTFAGPGLLVVRTRGTTPVAHTVAGTGSAITLSDLLTESNAPTMLTLPVRVSRVLSLTADLTTTSAGSLTLLSTPIATAFVVNSGGAVVGPATVQRAIDPSMNPGPGYRHYAAPVSNSTVADLTTPGFMPVVNPAYNTSATPTTVRPFPIVYGYDDTRLATTSNNLSGFDKGYVSPATLTDLLTVGRGYTVNISASELVDFQGTLNNGSLTLPLTSTRSTAYPEGGWQLLGNPYPAPLDYSRVDGSDRLGLEAAIYVYQSTSQYAGQYRSYINGIGNPVLPLGQAFFARVAAGVSSATMTFRNSQRLTVPNGPTFQRTTTEPRMLVQLTLQGAGSSLLDEATVYFESGASSGFDPSFDAQKLPNLTGLNLSTSLASGQALSIDGQPALGPTQRVVSLSVGVPTAGSYTLAASQLLNLSTVSVYLRDRQSGVLIDLAQQPSYTFVVSTAATLVTGRFELVFSPQQVLATVPAALAQQVSVYPTPAKEQVVIDLPAALARTAVTATLVDALGRVVRTQVLPTGLAPHTLPLADLAAGVYALRLNTDAGLLVKKVVVE